MTYPTDLDEPDTAERLLQERRAKRYGRAAPNEDRLRRIYNERANGASMDLLRFKHGCSQDTVRKAFLHFGGDPLGKSKAKPSNRATPEAAPPPKPEPVQQRTFTPYTAQGAGRTWADPIQWHERCLHGRVRQFCTDCKRSQA